MNRYQKEVDDLIQSFKEGYWSPLEMMVRLTEETGELAREINHRFGPKKKKDTEDSAEIEEEIGDILFTITCLANSLDLNLDKGFDSVMNKYTTRDKDRWEKK